MKLFQKKEVMVGSITIFIGIFFLYAYLNEFFVLYIPSRNNYLSSTEKAIKITKKSINLYFYDGHGIRQEKNDVLWSTDMLENINYIMQQLLLLFYEEKVTPEKISLQTVLISPSGQDLYLSFNKTFLNPESSIKTKLTIIETILSTLRETQNNEMNVHFLVNHKPMIDDHLDFEQSWPM
ncbi:hypothetical protein A3F06_01445 [candidate division TM6 bacterium RIFCSPHIGHO2_12_FULL_36_22]|nr:MAG: hypothetical protein A3F06_01445 [candidate division TM6 bacterium RIFCSPHIGHO2_12_FULL_36_22]